jgi:hypothetical protein
MSKFSCANLPGHYEGRGIEVDVFPNQIVVRTRDVDSGDHTSESKHPSAPARDDGNQSLLSSMTTIMSKIRK